MSDKRPELWFYRGAAAAAGVLAAMVGVRKLLEQGASNAFSHWFDAWLTVAPLLTALILLWVAARLGVPEEQPAIKTGCRIGLLAGAVGFLGGILGPILFAPEANQGPLIGIFITGPAGAIFGTIVGMAAARARGPDSGRL